MTVGCLIITDGRGDYLTRMLDTLDLAPFDHVTVVDDSHDPAYHDWLIDTIPGAEIRAKTSRGLASSVQSGWDAMTAAGVDHVFHVEEDFTFPAQPPIDDMIRMVDADQSLAQVCLLRQPWSPAEIAAGGIIETDPAGFTAGLRHRKWFSFNPCIYPAAVMGHRAGLEADLTARLITAGYWFAYYGQRGDPPRCIHIGARRSPQWTL